MTIKHIRTIRSFVKREGRLTAGQQKALDTQWPIFGIEYSNQLLNLDQVFDRQAPHILEIGFGNGDSLWQMALANPDNDYLGIEVHRPGVGHLLHLIETSAMSNIRVSNHDAVEVLKNQIPDASLDRLQLFFPDPWHKKKHHKRRIVQSDFVALVVNKLRPGGIFHLATDWEHYAQHMLKILAQCEQLENMSSDSRFVERPDERPLTKFENRGHRLGHGVWDLLFKKQL